MEDKMAFLTNSALEATKTKSEPDYIKTKVKN